MPIGLPTVQGKLLANDAEVELWARLILRSYGPFGQISRRRREGPAARMSSLTGPGLETLTLITHSVDPIL
jgi:hypothetical protein